MHVLFRLIYASLLFYGAYLTALAHVDPSNPAGTFLSIITLNLYIPKSANSKDQPKPNATPAPTLTMGERILVNPQNAAVMALGLSIPQAYLALFALTSGQYVQQSLYPNTGHLCPVFRFETSVLNTILQVLVPLALVIIGGRLRLSAYRSLGLSFTFALKEPQKLVRSGPYRYLRHPSYTALILIWIGAIALCWRNDGPVLGCWISDSSIRWTTSAPIMAWYAALRIIVMILRIAKEEGMMARVFGDEYVKYKRETWGLLPGLW